MPCATSSAQTVAENQLEMPAAASAADTSARAPPEATDTRRPAARAAVATAKMAGMGAGGGMARRATPLAAIMVSIRAGTSAGGVSGRWVAIRERRMAAAGMPAVA